MSDEEANTAQTDTAAPKVDNTAAVAKIAQMTDEVVLHEMLDTCEDFDQRQAVRLRIKELTQAKRKATESRLKQIDEDRQDRLMHKVAVAKQNQADTLSSLKTVEVMSKTERARQDMLLAAKAAHENAKPTTRFPQNLPKSPGATKVQPSSSSSLQKLPGEKAAPNSLAAQASKQTAAVAAGGANRPNAAQIKDMILNWCAAKTRGYKNVNITNYSSSWADGLAFCALIHHFIPDAFDFETLDARNRKQNFQLAFDTAQHKADIFPLLEVDDMILMGNNPDWKCVFTYVQSIYRKFHNVK